MFYVYILKSKSLGIYYKGYTTQPEIRLNQHNNNESKFTSNRGPWDMIYLEKFNTKKEALVAEKKIKAYGSFALLDLINNPERNLLFLK